MCIFLTNRKSNIFLNSLKARTGIVLPSEVSGRTGRKILPVLWWRAHMYLSMLFIIIFIIYYIYFLYYIIIFITKKDIIYTYLWSLMNQSDLKHKDGLHKYHSPTPLLLPSHPRYNSFSCHLFF